MKLFDLLKLVLILGFIPASAWLSIDGHVPSTIKGHSFYAILIYIGIAILVLIGVVEQEKRRIRRSDKINGHLVAVLFALIVFTVTSFSSVHIYAAYKQKQFAAEIASYTEDFEALEGEPYIRGKVVAVNLSTGTLDLTLYPLISRSLQARSPEEVGTILQTRWTTNTTGTYGDGSESMRTDCALTLIDVTIDKVIFRTTFTGSSATPVKLRSGSRTGNSPKFNIVSWLDSLQRK